MSSRKGNSNVNLATKPSIPTQFRCKVGKEWKLLNAFSGNQQKLVQRMIDSRRPVNAANSGMTCMEHSSGCRQELKCELCRLTKHINDFSTSSRRNGDFRCKRCIAWVETQEPGVVPSQLETGHISVEERGPIHQTMTDEGFCVDGPQAPITGLAGLGLEDLVTPPGVDVNALIKQTTSDDDWSSVSERSSAASGPVRNGLPLHLQKAAVNDAATGNFSDTESIRSSINTHSISGGPLPPHIKRRPLPASGSDSASVSAESNNGPRSISTATTLKERYVNENPNHVSFIGWDSNGNQHEITKSVTASTRTTSSSGTMSEAGDGYQEPVWEMPQPRKGVNKWHKASEIKLSQTELHQQGGNHHVAARAGTRDGPSLEGERPEKPPVAAFCEPDEDDDEDIYGP